MQFNKKNFIITVVISIITVIIVLLTLSVFLDFKAYSKGGHLAPMHIPRPFRPRPQGILSVNDIRPWMTFGFLNKEYRLSDAYFKGSLGINDSAYPRLTIQKLSQEKNIQINDLINEVRTLLIKATSSTTSTGS